MAKKLIELRNVTKAYGDNVVVKNMNLYVNDNEFITFLGPSGCGKTTTLRMIGGFETPNSGEIILNGEVVNNLPPYQRPINTVFQRYALFPHLNVFDNVAFGLRNFNRVYEELKSNVRKSHEGERKSIMAKLNAKNISKEERAVLRGQLKTLRKTIKEEIFEKKTELVEKRLEACEKKYERIIPDLEERIEVEWNKDDEVKKAKLRINEINEEIAEQVANGANKNKGSKKYEAELKQL